jgi:hypothetical protein
MHFCPVDIWTDCLYFFGVDIDYVSGAKACVLAERLWNYILPDENNRAASSLFEWYQRTKEQASVDNPVVEPVVELDTLLHDDEFSGLFEVEVV